MPRILQMFQMEDGRMAVVLDVPPTQDDPGSVTLWTEPERTKAMKAVILAEREECCALVWGTPEATMLRKERLMRSASGS